MKQVLLNSVEVSILELEKIHRFGNKYYKLNENLIQSERQGYTTLLSFGGAWSNHIHALARMGSERGFRTIGVIRGEQPSRLSAMLSDVKDWGMRLEFVSRQAYRDKDSLAFQAALRRKFGDFYLLPEGGTNILAVQGCGEIVNEIESPKVDYDLICLPVGTGGTIGGIASRIPPDKCVLGFVVLKGATYLEGVVRDLVKAASGAVSSPNWSLTHDYHCGGYAKCPERLKRFIIEFEAENQIPLDPVYTGKMLFGLSQMIQSGRLVPGSRVIAIHTGGLQGRRGFSF